MIPSGFLPIANHLWQSTLFAGIAGLLTLLLRNNRAHARYCLWLAASAKFLVPFAADDSLVGCGLDGVRSSCLRPRDYQLSSSRNEPLWPSSARTAWMPHASNRGLWLLRCWLRCGRLAAVLWCSRGGCDGGEYRLPSARRPRCLWGSAFQRCLRHRSLSLECSAYSVRCCCYRTALGIASRQRNSGQFSPTSCVTFAGATIWRR